MKEKVKNSFYCFMAITLTAFITGCKGHHEDHVPHVKRIILNKENLTLKPEEEETLLATVTPPNAMDATVAWSSNNESVATVEQDGVVTALTKGTAVITATAGGKSTTCTITVIERVPATITAQEVENALSGTGKDPIVIDGDLTLDYAKEVVLGANHTLTIPSGKTLTLVGMAINGHLGNPRTLTVNGGGKLIMKGKEHSSFVYGTLKLENITARVQNIGHSALESSIYIGNNATLIVDAPQCVTPIYISEFHTLTVGSGGKLEINNFVNLAIQCFKTLLIDGGTVNINGLGKINDDWLKADGPLAIGLIHQDSNLEIRNGGKLTSSVEGGNIFLFGTNENGCKIKGASGLFKTSSFTLQTDDEVEVGPEDATDTLKAGRYKWSNTDNTFVWASAKYI